MRQAYDYWQDQPGSFVQQMLFHKQKLVVVVRTTRSTRREPTNTPSTRGSGRKTAEPTARRTKGERACEHARSRYVPYISRRCVAGRRHYLLSFSFNIAQRRSERVLLSFCVSGHRRDTPARVFTHTGGHSRMFETFLHLLNASFFRAFQNIIFPHVRST